MTNIYAFIVGIEKYNLPDWNRSGPVPSALKIAEWCIRIQVPPANMQLFLSINGDDGEWLNKQNEAISSFRTKHPKASITADTTLNAIDTFWRQKLPKLGKPDSRLLVYWCGHGVTTLDRDRVLIHTDYDYESLTDRVTSVGNLGVTMQTQRYQHFKEQLLLADVCGEFKKDFTTSPSKHVPGDPTTEITQHQYLASLNGVNTAIYQGGGLFTESTLDVLNGFDSWPELGTFHQRMKVVNGNRNEGVFHFTAVTRTETQDQSNRVSTIPTATGFPIKAYRTFDELMKDNALINLLDRSGMFDEFTARATILDSVEVLNPKRIVIPGESSTSFIERLIQLFRERKLLHQTYNLLKRLPEYNVRKENFPELGVLLDDCERLVEEQRRVAPSGAIFPRAND